jgi:hypothetical protein
MTVDDEPALAVFFSNICFFSTAPAANCGHDKTGDVSKQPMRRHSGDESGVFSLEKRNFCLVGDTMVKSVITPHRHCDNATLPKCKAPLPCVGV